MDGNGLDLGKLLPKETLSVEPLIVRFESIGFKFKVAEDGSDGTLQFIWMHPLLPICFEIPFERFYMSRFKDQVTNWSDEAEKRAETTSA